MRKPGTDHGGTPHSTDRGRPPAGPGHAGSGHPGSGHSSSGRPNVPHSGPKHGPEHGSEHAGSEHAGSGHSGSGRPEHSERDTRGNASASPDLDQRKTKTVKEREEALDDALEDTFPASDPVSTTPQPPVKRHHKP